MSDRFLFLCIVALACLFILFKKESSVWHISKVSGNAYYVKNAPDAEKAADHLARLDILVKKFLASADPSDHRIQNIHARWSGTLSETPTNADNVAYSLGKNSIFICVREKDGGLTDINTSMFVLLH